MRARRQLLWLAAGMAGVIFAGACGDPKVDSDGAAPATDTTTTVTAPSATTTTVGSAPLIDGVVPPEPPQVIINPSRAVAGTRVYVYGPGFTADHWRSNADLWLSIAPGQQTCDLLAEAESEVVIDEAGRLEGNFVVPDAGTCRFGTGEEVSTAGLEFRIAYQCTPCFIASLTVLRPDEPIEQPPGTLCEGSVGFGVQDFADQIYADGLSCEEATDFVRAHAGPWQPPEGPIHVDAGGFSCDRTRFFDTLPPEANYRCAMGPQTISFFRT